MSNVNFISVLFIAIGLSADCFAVALSGSISQRALSWIRVTRVSLSFGVFQALMPVLGWLLGRTVVDLISSYDHWLAFLLLAFVGGRMVWGSLQHKDVQRKNADITNGVLLLTLSVATSIDALAVGLSFAFLRVDIWSASAIIGLVAFVATGTGFLLGRKLGGLAGKRAEMVGGLVLIAIGLRILLEHML